MQMTGESSILSALFYLTNYVNVLLCVMIEEHPLNTYLEFYPFNGGEVAIKLVKHSNDDKTYSCYEITKGKFQCTNPECNKIFDTGSKVLPVYWDRKPSNFVCIYCRGLFKNV